MGLFDLDDDGHIDTGEALLWLNTGIQLEDDLEEEGRRAMSDMPSQGPKPH